MLGLKLFYNHFSVFFEYNYRIAFTCVKSFYCMR